MNRPYWGVDAEIAFIAGLGTYTGIEKTRGELLRGYLNGMALRVKGFSVRDMVLLRERAAVELNQCGVTQ